MPPLDLQQQFVNYAKIIEASQQKQIESSNNIKNQFEALNSLLFKGKLIV